MPSASDNTQPHYLGLRPTTRTHYTYRQFTLLVNVYEQHVYAQK
jgi:hypothetical protein